MSLFTEQPYYEAKVFLKSYSDALLCLKETAELKAHQDYQEHVMSRLVEAKKKAEIDVKDGQMSTALNFANGRETKLYQFSNFIFAKYLKGFDEYSGQFRGLQQIVLDGLYKLKGDCK